MYIFVSVLFSPRWNIDENVMDVSGTYGVLSRLLYMEIFGLCCICCFSLHLFLELSLYSFMIIKFDFPVIGTLKTHLLTFIVYSLVSSYSSSLSISIVLIPYLLKTFFFFMTTLSSIRILTLLGSFEENL